MLGFMERAKGNNASDNNQNNNSNQNNNQNSDNNNNDNNNNSNNNNDNNNQNNNQNNNMDNNKSIWDNNDNDSGNNNEQNNQQNNQNQDTRTPAEIFDAHVADLDLTSGIDLSQMQEDAQNGNTDSLNKSFETVAANVYKAALQQMNTIADNKITAAIDKAVSESTSVMNETTAVKEMQSALPFTMGKDIAPVAEAALKQLMNNGSSIQDAVKQVSAFFQSTADAVSSNNNNNQGDPSSGNFNPNTTVNNNSNNRQNNNSNQEDTWMDFLTQ